MDLRHLCLAVAACAVLAAPVDLTIASGITPAQNIFKPIAAALEKATGIRLVLKDARSPEAWRLLAAGEADAAAAGLTWEDWLATIQAQNLPLPQAEAITLITLGQDSIQVITHQDILLLELDAPTLRGLFSGRIRSWKELGLADAPVLLLFDPNQIATNDTFRAQVMAGEPFGPNAWSAPKGTSLAEAVAATPGAIGFAPKAALANRAVNSPMTPPVTRPILLLLRGRTEPAPVKALVDFIQSREGQRLVIR